MPVVNQTGVNFNGYSNQMRTTTKTITALFKSGSGTGDIEQALIGDTILIGALPANSFVTECHMYVAEAFDTDTTFDLGYSDGAFEPSITGAFASAIDVSSAEKVYAIMQNTNKIKSVLAGIKNGNGNGK